MDLRLWLTAVIICRMHSFIHLSRSNMPIISLQVSWLKGVIFPLSNACCSSSAVIPPLLSASTAYTRDREVTRQRYKTGLNKTQHCKSWRLMNGEQLPILVEHSDHKATRFDVEVGVVPVEECLANLLGSDGIAIILIYCLVIYKKGVGGGQVGIYCKSGWFVPSMAAVLPCLTSSDMHHKWNNVGQVFNHKPTFHGIYFETNFQQYLSNLFTRS